jgi:NADP-dependent aldehyde dehydrogenase
MAMQTATVDKPADIDNVMEDAWHAFHIYRKLPLQKRAHFLRTIADHIMLLGDELIQTCMKETHLAEGRLQNERGRTVFQLNSYAAACEEGAWLSASIDTADPLRNPPKPDIRKMLVPLGPVVVFGASNFPFAFSTAGGDTATAFAAGCPVVVKAHSAHIKTSRLVAGAILKAAQQCDMPEGIFAHVEGRGVETGKELVMHPHTKAVGFTGSFAGGEAIWKMANSRATPIPVFAEMSSINPVFLLPEKTAQEAVAIAKMYAGSITLGSGQFCTNPGLIIGIAGESLDLFTTTLSAEITNTPAACMLHSGIAKHFRESRTSVLSNPGVTLMAETTAVASPDHGIPSVATVDAATFLENHSLRQEVFGPFSLIVRCSNMEQMMEVALSLEGQLTATLMATNADIAHHHLLTEIIKNICGRLIVNNVPTGVEVCLSMHHGGPWPSTTDSRFTSVGADGIKRFARPLSFQNCPDNLLPDELKNANPAGIWRTVNNQLTKASLVAL